MGDDTAAGKAAQNNTVGTAEGDVGHEEAIADRRRGRPIFFVGRLLKGKL